MSNRSRYKPAFQRCKFCGKLWWANTQARLEAWMVHHTSKECPVSAIVLEKMLKARESGEILDMKKLIVEAQDRALREGLVMPDDLAELKINGA